MLAWIAGGLLGVSMVACDQAEVGTTPVKELKGEVELTPLQDMAAEGEVIPITIKRGDGQESTHNYVMRNGELMPMGDAPDVDLPESHELGIIPASINGGSSYSAPTTRDREPGAGLGGDWSPSRLQSSVPEIQVDPSFRIETGSFVHQLQDRGRNVHATAFESTGPSRATELTRLEIDGIARAEIYQFDQVRDLDAWYRVAYQLHESVGHDPDACVRIHGMTLLRLGENADEAVAEAFLDSSRLDIR